MNNKKDEVLSFIFDKICDDTVKTTDINVEAKVKNALVEDGYIGKALRFQFQKKGGVMMKPGTVSSFWSGKSGFTVSMWLMPYQSLHASWHYRLLSVYGSDNISLLEMSYSSPSIRVKVPGANGSMLILDYPYALKTRIPPFDAPNTNDGVWQLAVLTLDFENNTLSFYIDGKEIIPKIESDVLLSGSLSSAQNNISVSDCIGGDPEEGERSFNGIIDDVKFRNYPMSSSEVFDLYSEYGPSKAPSVTETQERLDALVEKLGSSLVVKNGTSNVVCRGRVVKADVNNYSVKNIVVESQLYIPSNLCERYFGSFDDERLYIGKIKIDGITIDGVKYFKAASVCEAIGWKYVDLSAEIGLFLLLANDSTLDVESDADCISACIPFCDSDENEPKIPVEQTRVVIARSDTHAGDYTYSPSITKAGDILYASRDISCRYTEIFRSDDNGATWRQVGKVDGMWWATIFENRGDIYLIGRYLKGGMTAKGHSYIGISRSTDNGETWSEIREGQGAVDYYGFEPHCAPTPVLPLNGRLYRVFESVTPEKEKRAFVVSADADSDLLSPDSWSISDYFTGYGFPNEGNAVKGPDGKVWIMSRCVTNKAFLMKLNDDGTIVAALGTNKDSEIDFPSTQAKFTVRFDEKTGLYIGIANTQVDINCDGQRNYASLVTSKNLINWEVREMLLCDREICHPTLSVAQHAFQYIDWIFDGDDILFAVRESAEDAANFHDSNYLTFYRIENYEKYI